MMETVSLRRLILAGAFSVLFMPLTPAQNRNIQKDSTGPENAEAWTAEALSLLDRIKAGDSPTLRAWLYTQTAAWLAERREPVLQQEALRVAITGLADIKEHEKEIPATPANFCRSRLLAVIEKQNPETAQEAAQRFATKSISTDEEERQSLTTALRELNDPRKSEQALARAGEFIRSGNIPSQDLLGKMLWLKQERPDVLPPLLSAVLDLAEQSPNLVSFRSWTFFANLYMAETASFQLRRRFCQVLIRTAQARVNDLRSNQVELSSLVRLFQLLLPEMQKQAPETYAEAASVLASIAPPASNAAKEYNAASQRIKDSIDPALQAKTEARVAGEKWQKRSLLELGSLMARRKGDLMGAAELIVESKKAVERSPENYTEAEAYLSEIAQAAIEKKEVKVARFAIEHLDLPLERAAALRLLALYFMKTQESHTARETLTEATKTLRDAAPTIDRALAYFQFLAEWRKVDEGRAQEFMVEAVKAANSIPRPNEDEQEPFSFSLWPLAEAVRQAFNDLARDDTGSALSLSEDFRLKEMGAAARLGIYQSHGKPAANRQ